MIIVRRQNTSSVDFASQALPEFATTDSYLFRGFGQVLLNRFTRLKPSIGWYQPDIVVETNKSGVAIQTLYGGGGENAQALSATDYGSAGCTIIWHGNFR